MEQEPNATPPLSSSLPPPSVSSWFGKPPTDEERQAKWRYMQEQEANNTKEWRRLRKWEIKQGVQRIYYINLDKNFGRRQQMENALQQVQPPIPYYRFAALTGTLDGSQCVKGKQDSAWCRGISGLSDTNRRLLETQNMSGGLTMILEDDYVLAPNRTLWEAAIQLVPDDNWDVIRFMLKNPNSMFPQVTPRRGVAPWDFNKTMEENVRKPAPPPVYRYTKPKRKNTEGDICQGTHVQIWRESSLYKLHRLWSRRPYEDIDCAFTMAKPAIRSYVVGVFGDHDSVEYLGDIIKPPNEDTDIPKQDHQLQKNNFVLVKRADMKRLPKNAKGLFFRQQRG